MLSVVQTFIQHITGIYISDQMLFPHSAVRKTNWYKKVLSIHIAGIFLLCKCQQCVYLVCRSHNGKERQRIPRNKQVLQNIFLCKTTGKLLSPFDHTFQKKRIDIARTFKRSTQEKWKESQCKYSTGPGGPAFRIDPCFRMFHLNLI